MSAQVLPLGDITTRLHAKYISRAVPGGCGVAPALAASLTDRLPYTAPETKQYMLPAQTCAGGFG
jgi:hypothetical protein